MTAVLIDNSAESSGAAEKNSRRRRLLKLSDSLLYVFYQGSTVGFGYAKSTDGGATWGSRVNLGDGSASEIAWDIYYKRWNDSGNANIVDLFTTVDGASQGLYHGQLNLDTDTVDAMAVVVGTASFGGATGGCGVGVSESGRIYISGGGAFLSGNHMRYSDDEGATWHAAGATFTVLDNDHADLWADFSSADPDDICAIYQNGNADTLSIKQYDASLGTITTTSISTGIANTDSFGNLSSALASDGHIKVAALDGSGSSASLKFWDVYGSTVTARTDVLTTTARIYNVAVSIMSTGRIVVFYGRDSAGASATALEVYYKYSDDDGVTWSAEQTYGSRDQDIVGLLADPRPLGTTVGAAWFEADSDDLWTEAPFPQLTSTALAGTLPMAFGLTGTLTGVTSASPPVVVKCRPITVQKVITATLGTR